LASGAASEHEVVWPAEGTWNSSAEFVIGAMDEHAGVATVQRECNYALGE
jgi:hypothetical protein